jgi:hypothetical protein
MVYWGDRVDREIGLTGIYVMEGALRGLDTRKEGTTGVKPPSHLPL